MYNIKKKYAGWFIKYGIIESSELFNKSILHLEIVIKFEDENESITNEIDLKYSPEIWK